MSFSEGFQGGWGLADSYLNRQDARKRQKVEDDRRAAETRYQHGRDTATDARNKRLDEFNRDKFVAQQDMEMRKILDQQDKDDAAEIRREDKAVQDAATHKDTLERNDQIIAEGKRKEEENQRKEHNRKRSLAYHKLRSLPDPEDLSDPRVIEALREVSVLSGIDIENPGEAWAHYARINNAIQKGEFTEQDAVAANAVYGEALNQRPTAIDEAKMVRSIDGKELTIPAGSEITDREIIGLTPVAGGKGFVMQLRIKAKGPDGKEYDYLADATAGGSASNKANPQVHQPQEFLGINQLKMDLIKRMKETTALIDRREGANYANSEVGIGQLAINKNKSEITKNASLTAKADRETILKNREVYDAWTERQFPNRGDKWEQVNTRRTKTAWTASLQAITPILSRGIPSMKGDIANLHPVQRDLIFGEFMRVYKDAPSGFFTNKKADNSHLEGYGRLILKKIKEQEERNNPTTTPTPSAGQGSNAGLGSVGKKNLSNVVTAESLDAQALEQYNKYGYLFKSGAPNSTQNLQKP